MRIDRVTRTAGVLLIAEGADNDGVVERAYSSVK